MGNAEGTWLWPPYESLRDALACLSVGSPYFLSFCFGYNGARHCDAGQVIVLIPDKEQ